MNTTENRAMKTILAIASGGGHWVQLLRLRPAFENCNVIYASVRDCYSDDVPEHKFVTIPDATRWGKIQLLFMAVRVSLLVLRLRPEVIVSTGAAPGYVALRVGKLIRSKTIWLDSIANAEALSLSGEMVGKYADLWLTQWKHLECDEGPSYGGSVI